MKTALTRLNLDTRCDLAGTVLMALLPLWLPQTGQAQGTLAENLLITDSIPVNTRYTPSSITLDSSTLTDGPGDDPGSFSGNLVSVDLGNTSRPANFVITLDVTIN